MSSNIQQNSQQDIFLCREEAYAAISEDCILSPPSHKDPIWTPRRNQDCFATDESSSDDETSEKTDVLTVYNKAIASIASLSDASVTPLTQVLDGKWEHATANEKSSCIKQVEEACNAVCKVIAPTDNEELFKSFLKQRSSDSDDLKALVEAYKNAPSKSAKTQILSIYACQYPYKYLQKLHEPFEKLSTRQIKKARSHTKNFGPCAVIVKQPVHRVRIDLIKLEHFLRFVDQPYFYQDVVYGTRNIKLDSGEQFVMPNIVRTVTRSTMIEQYIKHCKDENVGRSWTFNII